MAQGYEQGGYGPGNYGPGNFGPGNFGTGNFGPAGSAGPGDGSATATAPTGPRRARVGLIALIAFLIELLVIAAGFNQAVSKHLVSYINDHNPNSFVSSMVRAGLVFSWRLTPEHGDNQHGVHVWLSQIVGDVGVLVLTVLLILAIARGPITWGRAFFGIWMAVIVATCLAAVPALLVTRNLAEPGVDKATYAVFSGPNAYEFFAGAALGLVVALITSIVAIATRRPGTALAPVFVPDETARTPEAPPPYYGNAAPGAAPGGWSPSTSNQPTPNQPTVNEPVQSNRSESPTTAYPVGPPAYEPAGAPSQSESTTTLPRLDSGWHPGQRSSEPPKNESATSELPRAGSPQADAPKSDAPKSDAPKSDAPQPGGDSTTTLPRFAGGETGTWPPQAPPPLPAPGTSAPGTSATPPPATSAPAGGQPTAAFPLPPDDEDLGQHPDHD